MLRPTASPAKKNVKLSVELRRRKSAISTIFIIFIVESNKSFKLAEYNTISKIASNISQNIQLWDNNQSIQ